MSPRCPRRERPGARLLRACYRLALLAVIQRGRDVRLRSIALTDPWPVREALVAKCYRMVSRLPLLRRRAGHAPVTLECDCGIHAANNAAAAASYLHLYEDVPQRAICHRALGRGSLSGARWWRVSSAGAASRAYPQEIFLPASGAKRRVGLEAIVDGLAVYGVPIRRRRRRGSTPRRFRDRGSRRRDGETDLRAPYLAHIARIGRCAVDGS